MKWNAMLPDARFFRKMPRYLNMGRGKKSSFVGARILAVFFIFQAVFVRISSPDEIYRPSFPLNLRKMFTFLELVAFVTIYFLWSY